MKGTWDGGGKSQQKCDVFVCGQLFNCKCECWSLRERYTYIHTYIHTYTYRDTYIDRESLSMHVCCTEERRGGHSLLPETVVPRAQQTCVAAICLSDRRGCVNEYTCGCVNEYTCGCGLELLCTYYDSVVRMLVAAVPW